MRIAFFVLAALIAGFGPAYPSAGQDQKPLNVLLITVDDMNWDSLGCFGNDLPGVSPNLDQLANEGVRFDQAYVTIAICQPCRASIMTARYPHRSGALGFDKIKPDVPTLIEKLRAAGYYNACIGKAVHTVPSRHKNGFDETYDMHELGYGRSPQRYRQTTAEAIQNATDQGKPFFLNVNLHDPHRPFANAPQEQRDRRPKAWEGVPMVENPYQPEDVEIPGFLPDIPEVRKEIAEYYTSVRRCDMIIGEVLKVLDESGQADNTLVLFLSDHGIAVPFAKTNCYMHSNRTPLIVRWPGVAEAGSLVEEKMVNSIDLAPTILDALGMENLEGADGRSFRGLIDPRVPAEGAGRDMVFVHINYPYSRTPYPMRGVITKDGGGYIWNGWARGNKPFRNESMSGRTFAAMQQAAKDDPDITARVKHYLYRCPEELYDYQNDPDALNNLIDEDTPAILKSITDGRLLLLRHMQSTQDPQFDAFRSYLESIEAQALEDFDTED